MLVLRISTGREAQIDTCSCSLGIYVGSKLKIEIGMAVR